MFNEHDENYDILITYLPKCCNSGLCYQFFKYSDFSSKFDNFFSFYSLY